MALDVHRASITFLFCAGLRSLGYFTQGILQSGQSGLYPFIAVNLVVNTTGDSADQPPVAAIKAPAGQR